MRNAHTTAMAVCAVLLIGVGILAILNEPELEPAAQPPQPSAQLIQPTQPALQAAQPRQPAQPAAQPTEPPVNQEQAQTKQAKLTEQADPTERPAKRDLRNGDHATVKMKTFACKTMAYFDRWVALMKANDDEAANKFASATLGDCSVMSKGDEVIVEQVGRLFSYNACVREFGDTDCRWLRLSMLEAIE
jgi:type IV secretory pathway VirB10-like protein